VTRAGFVQRLRSSVPSRTTRSHVAPSDSLVGVDRDACLITGAGAPITSGKLSFPDTTAEVEPALAPLIPARPRGGFSGRVVVANGDPAPRRLALAYLAAGDSVGSRGPGSAAAWRWAGRCGSCGSRTGGVERAPALRVGRVRQCATQPVRAAQRPPHGGVSGSGSSVGVVCSAPAPNAPTMEMSAKGCTGAAHEPVQARTDASGLLLLYARGRWPSPSATRFPHGPLRTLDGRLRRGRFRPDLWAGRASAQARARGAGRRGRR
jgi:hypothetical protein